jgi:MFS family permease
VLGALFNVAFAWFSTGLASAMAFRFLVGLAIAGMFPLGTKLIVSWDPARAGQGLGVLVGMLTLGTALSHGIRMAGAALSWQLVILLSALLALIGAGLIAWLGDGPHPRLKPRVANEARSTHVLDAFSVPGFRASAFVQHDASNGSIAADRFEGRMSGQVRESPRAVGRSCRSPAACRRTS